MLRLKDKDVLSALLKAGFLLKRIRGSHYHLVNPITGRRVTIPVHGEILAPKTLKTILRQAEMEIEQLKGSL